jgi:stage II sporulation protein D
MVGTIVTGVTDLTGWPRRRLATLAVVASLAVSGLTVVASATGQARAATATVHEVYPVPPGGVYTIHGRGNGHGHGMSQWGAYGAAKVDHLSSNQILHFYYPHTTLATRSTMLAISVQLSLADSASLGYVQVNPAIGMSVTPTGGKTKLLPTRTAAPRHTITSWRLARSGTAVVLRYLAVGKWHTLMTVGKAARITDTARQIPVVEPNGVVSYRGSVFGELEAGALEAVNLVNLELYLQSVVPSEVSPSWPAATLEAQAVAARTYALHGMNNPKTSYFEVDGDTRDQAYGGVGVESPRSTSAIQATAGEVIVDSKDHPILAQYASADGGWTVSGGVDYLPAEADPYDGAVPNTDHAWVTTVSASEIQSDYPQIGTLADIDITGRDGNGLWGGRVTTLKLVGSKATLALTGTELQETLGFGSPWFRPVPLPAAPGALTASAKGGTVTAQWKAPASITGAAPVTGYVFTLSPGAHHQTLAATALTASVAKLAPGTYTISVVAQSAAGNGPPATTTVKVVSGT